MAVENLFHATNVRSALKLGHARGVAMLAAAPAPHDAADALAVAICHLHSMAPAGIRDQGSGVKIADPESPIPDPRSLIPTKRPRTWRQYRPPAEG